MEIVFSVKRNPLQLSAFILNGIPLPRRCNIKHLGVIPDEKLTFIKHLEDDSVVCSSIALLLFLSKSVDGLVLDIAYEMYVRCRVD